MRAAPWTSCALWLLCLSSLPALAAPVEATTRGVRRFAVLAGANDGGKERVLLRYAGTDARRLAEVLGTLGGVAVDDLTLLDQPSASGLRAVLEGLEARLARARQDGAGRLEVLFYYSGHADETSLLLGQERLGYEELKRRLDGLSAEVRIAIVDACASGALTRGKGGVSRPPFLLDASNQLKGHAFLSSASADEAAQESERLKASVFTHALLSGLRGAADASRDGRVTLSEAYQFAFNETLARTASTLSGPQRPGFDIQLVGTGEVVLTDVRTASAQLHLEAGLAGRVFVLNASGALVVEVAKAPGAPLTLGVEPGAYRVLVDGPQSTLREVRLALVSQEERTVTAQSLRPVERELLVRRGVEPVPEVVEPDLPYQPVDVAFVYPVSFAGLREPPPRVNFSLGVLASRVGQVDGVSVASVGTWVDRAARGVNLAGVAFKAGASDGLTLAAALVVTSGTTRGLTASAVALSGGDVWGGQVAAVAVAGGALGGAQLSAVNVAGARVDGLQAGAVNVGGAGLRGLQAGAVSVAGGPDSVGGQLGAVNVLGGNLAGAQLGAVNVTGARLAGGHAGVVNVASGGFDGLQVGVASVAGGLMSHGLQVGVLNIGGDVTGAQVGVVNIAGKVTGAQVGLVNVARTASAPVGLVNAMAEGRVRAALWAGETSVASVAVKLGTEHLYSYVVGGWNPWGGQTQLSVGLGLGLHLPLGRFHLSLEGDVSALQRLGVPWESVLLLSQRLVAGWAVVEGVSVFAGPQLTQVVATSAPALGTRSGWGFPLGGQAILVPGAVLGVEFN